MDASSTGIDNEVAALGAALGVAGLMAGEKARERGYCGTCFGLFPWLENHPRFVASAKSAILALFRLAGGIFLMYDIIADWRLFYHVGKAGHFADIYCCKNAPDPAPLCDSVDVSVWNRNCTPVNLFAEHFFTLSGAALHSYGLDPHSSVELCNFMTGSQRVTTTRVVVLFRSAATLRWPPGSQRTGSAAKQVARPRALLSRVPKQRGTRAETAGTSPRMMSTTATRLRPSSSRKLDAAPGARTRHCGSRGTHTGSRSC